MLFLGVPDSGGDIIVEKNQSRLAVDMPATHSHGHHEIYFLLSGERRYFVGHKIFDVSPGNLVVIPKNEIHRTGARGKKGYERYVVYFSDEAVSELVHTLGEESLGQFLSCGCVQFGAEHIKHLREMFDAMYSEQTCSDELSLMAQKSLLFDIAIKTLRHGKPRGCATTEGADKIQLVAAYISENYATEITLTAAADMACMEPTYFSKRFKTLTGFGFSEYLMRTRINAAASLLEKTGLNISEISEACGFSGSNYFGDVFKRALGVSPSEYRKGFVRARFDG